MFFKFGKLELVHVCITFGLRTLSYNKIYLSRIKMTKKKKV